MSIRFSIVMTAFDTWHFLPRAVSCVAQQEYSDWELLLFADGPSPKGRYAPARILTSLRRRYPGNRIAFRELPRAEGCFGNVARNAALEESCGDYVCWVNHDNLIGPGYLCAHLENIAKTDPCLSVVDVDLWQHDRFCGRYPRAFRSSRIDLLCFAVPLQMARKINAFGGEASRVYAADWLTFDACRRHLPVVHNRRLVGTHF